MTDLSHVGLLTTFLSAEAKSFAEKFNLAVNPANIRSYELVLEGKDHDWHLSMPGQQRLKIDFDENKMDYQRKNISRKNILARALGIKGPGLRVLDLTAGLGIDAVHLAKLGCRVVSLERNALLFFLLQQAQLKTEQAEIKGIEFHLCDAHQFLLEQGEKIKKNFDVIYYDPMYPEKKKSALPRKEMQAFRQLVGEDDDAQDIRQLCFRSKINRFVMKRPLRSSEKEKKEVGFAEHLLKGTTIQYQVFIRGKDE